MTTETQEYTFPAMPNRITQERFRGWLRDMMADKGSDSGQVGAMLWYLFESADVRALAAQQECERLERLVFDLRSDVMVATAMAEHALKRQDAAKMPRLDVEADDFMAGVEPLPPRADQCPDHGLVRIGGVCRMCEPSVPALREPALIFVRRAETARTEEGRRYNVRESVA